MSDNNINEGGAGSNAGAFPKPDPKLLQPHIDAGHDLIPLHRPADIWNGRQMGKAPIDDRWTERSYDGQDPAAWMVRGQNVGVRLHDDQLVIDIDPRHFDGADRLAELCARFAFKLDDYPFVRSGGGGWHIYMRKPHEMKVCEMIDDLPGIEFKTKGRQMAAAGSVHPDTKRHYMADDPFSELASPPMAPDALLRVIERKQTICGGGEAHITNDELAQLLAVLNPVQYGSYDKWLRLMMACHHGTGGDGMQEFLDWSAGDPAYANCSEKNAKQWASLHADRPGGVTVKTLFKAVSETGHAELVASVGRKPAVEEFDDLPLDISTLNKGSRGMPTASFSNCLRVLELAKLGFAYDELASQAMLRAPTLPWQIDIGRELNDDLLRILRHYLIAQTGIEFSKDNVVEAALTLARQSPFNPVLEYLNRLEWDRTMRLDNWLTTYLGADDTEFARAVGRLILLAAVRRARSPGTKFDNVLILEGKQGTGKSSAISILGGEWYSDAELGRLDSKEAPQVLRGVWIHELGELTALRQSETADLKAFVSRREDRYRGSYERLAKSEPRRCIFIGTTNAESYLMDTTGNRRFWPVKTGAIDIDALKRDRDQLWAEAVAAEISEGPLVLPRHLWVTATEEQDNRLAEDPWKDRVRAWLDGELISNTQNGPTTSERRDRVHTRDILECALNIDPARQNQQLAKRLRDVMRSISGWTYKRGLRVSCLGTAAGYERDGSCPAADPFEGL